MAHTCFSLLIAAAVLMYAFADLRLLARKGKLQENSDSLLQLPVRPHDVVSVVEQNLPALKTLIGKDVDVYLSSLSSMHASWQRQSVSETGEADYSELVVFEDTKADSELVYGIGVNNVRRRITVAFRGSVTILDFRTDAKALLTNVANPVQKGKVMGIHHGFYDYLFGSRTTKDGSNKCTEIMSHVLHLLEQHPGYRLYVTGHSLGGALATLFAVEAAADHRIPCTVTCISIASPKVGSMTFRRAVQDLEGRLRCLRIANHKDLVTLLPDRGSWSCAYIMCCQSNVYRHAGLEVKLYSSSQFVISKAGDADKSYMVVLIQDGWKQFKHAVSVVLSLPCVCCCREDFLKYHGCKEYMERLLGNERGLHAQQLNDLHVNIKK
jgi:hypothetical protein